MSRIRITKPIISTRAEAERMLGEVTALTAQLNSLKAELDRELTATRKRFEGRIDELKVEIEQKSALLQQWAEASPEDFAERKSVEFLHGRVGFRTGNPTLKTLSGWTFKRVLEVITRSFVRVKEELDKEAILAAYAAGTLTDGELRAVGLRVVQDESFYVDPKVEEAAGKVTVAA